MRRPGASFPCAAPHRPADYNKARALTQEAAALAGKILDARLALTRLRQAHPHPRLTIPAANAQLDAQVAEMQELDDELQQLNGQVDDVKERVKAGARDVERLRVERADVEKTAKAAQDEVQDGRVIGLYDWSVLPLLIQCDFGSRHGQVHGLARAVPRTCLLGNLTL